MSKQQPRYYLQKGATTIVIFIHGIVEGPDQFLDLMELASGYGFAIASLLLPGHGGTGEEFAHSCRQQWMKHVNSEVGRYKEIYDSVILVGHSMGSLLSFITYVESPEQVIGIVAIDTPLYVKVKGRAIRNNLKVAFSKHIAEDDPAYALLKASSVAPCSIFTYLTWAPRMIDLFRLMKKTRKLLCQVSVPTLVFHAADDELVSASSVKVFKKTLPADYSRIVLLKNSTHFICEQEDLALLHKTFCSFLISIKERHF
ncbi:carboxylesterase [Parabacteroides sp. AM08-6]|uniref:alpha/beta hydrolase n=1 Tax=Parabacteroides sp. AM08-6 TaxID=2292053 RepID=UPI000F0078DF|nr:alpha/beta fold hydrolase [Parabacteroides sp. AM08-6]RHJ79125.1 alpha/beta fold hydrolase [Parabacteroides sp. AM08-6]